MLAGLRFMLVAFRRAVCRPAGHSAAPAAGLWPDNIALWPVCLCSRYRLGMPAGLASLIAAGASLYHHSWRLRLWRTLTGQAAGGIALAIFGVLVLVEGSLGGEHVPLVGFMLTLAAALSWACGNIFNKNHVPGDPPIISLVVERIDPGAAVYVCLVAGSMARSSCWRVYARSIC